MEPDSNLRVVPASLDHVPSLVADVREIDRIEWVLGTGLILEDQLRAGLGYEGALTRSLLDEAGRCLCIWGVTPTPNPAIGQAWLIATNAAQRRAREIHHKFAPLVAELLDHWPTLAAWSHEDNAVHHLWMRRMGFEYRGVGEMYPFLTKYHLYTLTRGGSHTCVDQ